MSSLIFYTDETQAVVATDTLAVNNNGQPIAFVSKSGYIPHLKTIVTGTGAGGFANKWLLEASTRMVVRGIQNLNYHTPKALNRLWLEYKKNSLPLMNLQQQFINLVFVRKLAKLYRMHIAQQTTLNQNH